MYIINIQKIDKDNSGTINKEELNNLFEEIGVPLSKKDIDNLFDILDVDKSGSLSYSELKNELISYCESGKALLEIAYQV